MHWTWHGIACHGNRPAALTANTAGGAAALLASVRHDVCATQQRPVAKSCISLIREGCAPPCFRETRVPPAHLSDCGVAHGFRTAGRLTMLAFSVRTTRFGASKPQECKPTLCALGLGAQWRTLQGCSLHPDFYHDPFSSWPTPEACVSRAISTLRRAAKLWTQTCVALASGKLFRTYQASLTAR